MPSPTGNCVFCDIVDGDAPAQELRHHKGAVSFRPLNPVVEGHRLVVPYSHVPDATDDPVLTGLVMEVAARLAHEVAPANIITSIGEAATQSVYHLHIHVVPRREGDGLKLPWSDDEGETPATFCGFGDWHPAHDFGEGRCPGYSATARSAHVEGAE